MTAVLADLAIEAEAALTLTHAHRPRARPSRRPARGRAGPARHGDRQILDLQARAGPRLRGAGMHRRLGGDGGSPMPRLYREAPVNAIWEGSGNVQCLDIARAIRARRRRSKPISPKSAAAKGESAALDAHVAALKDDMRDLSRLRGAGARPLRPAGASGFRRRRCIRAGSPVADAFCRSRLESARRAQLRRADGRRQRRRSSGAPRRGRSLKPASSLRLSVAVG